MNYDLPDHPVIQNMERTGYPDGKEPTFPICPVCGEECEEIFRDKDLNIVGCDICIKQSDAWEEPECFPGKEHWTGYHYRKQDAGQGVRRACL